MAENFFLNPNELEDLNEIFDVVKNKEDLVNTAELKKGFEMMKFDRTQPRIYELICKLPDVAEYVTREEFLKCIHENVGHKYTEDAKQKLFETMCEKDPEKITKEDLMQLVKLSGDSIKDTEIMEMIQQFSNQKDHIDLGDFSILIKKKFIGYS